MKKLILSVLILLATPVDAKWTSLTQSSEKGDVTYVSSDARNRMSMSCNNGTLGILFELDTALSTQKTEGRISLEFRPSESEAEYPVIGFSTPFNRTIFSINEQRHGKKSVVELFKAMMSEDEIFYNFFAGGEYQLSSKNLTALARELKKDKCFATALNVKHVPNPKALWAVKESGVTDKISRGPVTLTCSFGSPVFLSLTLPAITQTTPKEGELQLTTGPWGYSFEKGVSVHDGSIQLFNSPENKERFSKVLKGMMEEDAFYFHYSKNNRQLDRGEESLAGFSSAIKEIGCAPK